MKPMVSEEVWHKRIKAARTRRERFEDGWAAYARLHTNAYLAAQDKNDDPSITLPSGDQVKLGLIHRNVEQTMGLLDVQEYGVRVTARDYTRELGEEDTHREAVVEQGLLNSIKGSGLVSGIETADKVKLDGTMIGHGINYTYYRVEETEVEREVPVVEEVEIVPGVTTLMPMIDAETGQPVFETEKTMEVWYEAVADEHVSPIEFLFCANSNAIALAPWHGREKIVALKTLRKDDRYKIPEGIEGSAYRRKDLYGNEQDEAEAVEQDSVKVIVVWDKENRELITFLEASSATTIETEQKKRGLMSKFRRKATTTIKKLAGMTNLYAIGLEKWPVRFELPDDSPFSFYIPIPANDFPFGVSQVEHTKNPALEADKIRTRMANITRQFKRLFLTKKGRLDEEQWQKAIRSKDMAFVALDMQEEDDLKKVMQEFTMPGVPMDFYKQEGLMGETVNRTSGVSDFPYGGADTATESENQMLIGGARPGRKKRFYFKFLSEVARKHKDFLKVFAPDGQPIRVMSAEGQPLDLEYGRAAFQGQFEIEVVAGGGAMTLSPVRQKIIYELATRFIGRYGPRFDKIFLRQVFTQLDIRQVNELVAAIPDMPPMPEGSPPEGFATGNYTDGQAIRAAINAPSEG